MLQKQRKPKLQNNLFVGITQDVAASPDLQIDDWIAVGFPRDWYPGQFVSYDEETKEVCVNFQEQSATNSRWFVWPALSGKIVEDKAWINEGLSFTKVTLLVALQSIQYQEME